MTSFTSTTDTIDSVLTDQARDLIARSMIGQVAFKLIGFKAGRAGYQVANPVLVEEPDSTSIDLDDKIFPLGDDPEAFVTIEQPYPNVLGAVCRLGRNDALYGIGEVGIFVQVTRVGTIANYQYTNGAGGIFFVAKAAGTAGNSVTFTFVNGGASQPLTIDTSGTDVTVNLATDSLSAVTSTMSEVAAAITADISANQVMSAASTGDGTALVGTGGPTSLAGGDDLSSLDYTEDEYYLFALAHTPLMSKTNKTVLVFRFIIAT